MAKKKPKAKPRRVDVGAVVPRAKELIESLGSIVLNTVRDLWLSEFDARTVVEECYGLLGEALATMPEVALDVSEGRCLANGRRVISDHPSARFLAKHLTDLEVSGFSLYRGLTFEEFYHLIGILGRPARDIKARGGFSSSVRTSGLRAVAARNVVYRALAEGDEVLVGREVEGIRKVAAALPDIQNILAFIKGDVAEADEATTKLVKETSGDPQKLVDLIMRAADVQYAVADLDGGETLSQFVVASLRRTVGALRKAPGAKTQKGRRDLARTLLLLEKQVVESMRTVTGEVTQEDINAISDAVEEMTDEVKVDAMTSDYLRKREAVAKSERDLLKYMKSQGPGDLPEGELRDRLMAGGLGVEGWQELVLKVSSGDGGDGERGGPGGGFQAVGQLASLLTHMTDLITHAEEDIEQKTPEELAETFQQTGNEVRRLAAETEKKVHELIDDIRKDTDVVDRMEELASKAKVGLRISRKRLLEILAEIVQELCQPLSVIRCSVDMLTGRLLGEVSEPQVDMLNLASGSLDRLLRIVEMLRFISGEPTSLHPDAQIQAALYGTEVLAG